MVLVLFLCIIIFIIILLNFVLLASTIRFRIENFEIANVKHIEPKYKVVISLKLFNKIKWLSFSLNSKKIKKMYTKLHLEKIDVKKIEKELKFSDIQEFLKIKLDLTHLNMKLSLGIDDVIITSFIVPIISSIFAIILPHITKEKDIKNINYRIQPIYNMGNVYHIKVTTTFEIKVINILISVYNILKNRKKENELKEIQKEQKISTNPVLSYK